MTIYPRLLDCPYMPSGFEAWLWPDTIELWDTNKGVRVMSLPTRIEFPVKEFKP